MPVYRLDDRLVFPPVDHAEDGLLAVGGDLTAERLVLAYSSGIFPWYSKGQPILWHSPDPRMVLLADDLHVPRSLKKTLRKGAFRFTLDEAFAQVIEACGRIPRPGQRDTWITPEMKRAYGRLHEQGLAHSAEAWHGRSARGRPLRGLPRRRLLRGVHVREGGGRVEGGLRRARASSSATGESA